MRFSVHTGWLTTQSAQTSLRAKISLLTGKITENSQLFARLRSVPTDCGSLFRHFRSEFPTYRNREYFNRSREVLQTFRGNFASKGRIHQPRNLRSSKLWSGGPTIYRNSVRAMWFFGLHKKRHLRGVGSIVVENELSTAISNGVLASGSRNIMVSKTRAGPNK
jgi:hypothetical protein